MFLIALSSIFYNKHPHGIILIFLLIPQDAGIAKEPANFCVYAGDPNSGPHVCDGAVLTEPSLLRSLTGPVAHQSASQAVQQAPGTCPRLPSAVYRGGGGTTAPSFLHGCRAPGPHVEKH